MNYQHFLKTKEWEEIKSFFKSEIIDTPLKIKTDGLSSERIALEVRGSQLASEKILKAIRKFERLGKKIERDNQSYK
jgi:hypothetical protein